MVVLVITGGIGCGKSSFCRLLSQLQDQTVVFDCDSCVHRLLTTESIVRKIVGIVGDEVVGIDGSIIRSRLRMIIFSDSRKRRDVERVLHPAVLSELEKAISKAEASEDVDLFVADVPLYFETENFDVKSDRVIVVGASRSVQLRRILGRSKGEIDPEAAAGIIDSQLPISVKIQRADRLVWNDGSKDCLRRQASRLLNLSVAP